MKTKDRILEKALDMMNRQGIENVSTYDMARALKIRQSNITYYFPTKADIINALAKRMIQEVDQPLESVAPGDFSFQSFYRNVDRVMQVHHRYRFLMMNYAPLITADPELNRHFVQVLKTRHAQLEGIIALLDANGYLKGKKMMSYSYPIMLMLNMLGIYWIQESSIYNADQNDETKRKHHLWLFFQIFVPYLTPKGANDLLPLFPDHKAPS